ncbi:BsaWI family type II restriction enzyme [Thermodesulfovibrio yellowstonii]|uniref:Restriction endonuclease subunit M n=1 Tax=Thermodesulfovibrio yellowstonii TaxID=28262 RepID=A0A9W6GFQ4_9BACT|nr:BsaWI family type II restriction enzyme [Thermodesulfovibrio islandicus]GLI52887.1 restriction endonuclease subunit M [Thermodesulfovibrio islandicus]
MKFKDILNLYKNLKRQYGNEAYKHISNLLKEVKLIHKRDWEISPTPNKDHEQSWRAFKGKNLEKLILHIIKDQVESLGLKIVEGNTLERKNSKNLSEELSKVKRNLLIHYGEFGSHLPDVDLIIYSPEDCKVIAVISSKVTLRERIAQTGYWKIKLSQDLVTRNIKVVFITLDEDGTLSIRKPAKKGRAIAEVDIDRSYVMNDIEIEESNKVKKFDKFIDDLKSFVN